MMDFYWGSLHAILQDHITYHSFDPKYILYISWKYASYYDFNNINIKYY